MKSPRKSTMTANVSDVLQQMHEQIQSSVKRMFFYLDLLLLIRLLGPSSPGLHVSTLRAHSLLASTGTDSIKPDVSATETPDTEEAFALLNTRPALKKLIGMLRVLGI